MRGPAELLLSLAGAVAAFSVLRFTAVEVFAAAEAVAFAVEAAVGVLILR